MARPKIYSNWAKKAPFSLNYALKIKRFYFFVYFIGRFSNEIPPQYFRVLSPNS